MDAPRSFFGRAAAIPPYDLHQLDDNGTNLPAMQTDDEDIEHIDKMFFTNARAAHVSNPISASANPLNRHSRVRLSPWIAIIGWPYSGITKKDIAQSELCSLATALRVCSLRLHRNHFLNDKA
jgi:hypothetical protein